MGSSGKTLALGALLGIGLITAACGASSTGTATTSPAASRPATTATSPAPSSPAPQVSQTMPAAALPGVVAECTSPPPYRLSTRPSQITLACADNGIGVEKMTWTSWAGSAAAGQGSLWENLCQPSCATGKVATYPVAVTLAVVKTSSQGPWFSRLTVAWLGNRPPNSTTDTFGLQPPSS